MALKPATAKEVAGAISSCAIQDIPGLCERYSDDPRRQVQKACATAMRKYEKAQAEKTRVSNMYAYEAEIAGKGICIGLDEVGRGSLAGPLTVCAVALPQDPIIWGINDSKKLTPSTREVLAEEIKKYALAIGIAHIPPEKIDEWGMSKALKMAFAQAIEDTGVDPSCVLLDGNPMHIHPKEKNVIKGDAKIACIAAASIVAKVTRDAMMVEADPVYPQYHFADCKGYASPAHIEAIRQYGLSPMHRLSFCGNFLETPSLF